MNIPAALPDHIHQHDPLRTQLLRSYWHVITPLRYLGWTTDVDTADKPLIRADLGDGTELIITTEHGLPRDSGQVNGWRVLRRDIDNPERHTALYDSAPGGPQSHHRAGLVPLFARIDALDAPKPAVRLATSATYCTPYGLNANRGGSAEAPGVAVARYFESCQYLTAAEGYQRIWERPEGDGYPLAAFEKDGYLAAVRVNRIHD
ncbi:hypothetical protein [Streptomyces sp. MUSC 14]|uniref:hypothetical protein n=1 Tax=Streptomyces sp. MUSC 14 TaxID=1354889 RepID=UPI0008F59FD9|nr:hypothetical protein [Streptomyces sp. MUSC 14]